MTSQRDRTTLRRALRGGAFTGGPVAVLLVAAAALTGGEAVAAAVMAGIAVAAVVAAGWLLLAAALDVVAGEPPGARRLGWTAGATLLALLGPFLVLGALTAGR